MHPESSGGASIPPGPPSEHGVTIQPDERISSQENGLNSETLHPETGTANLPEEQRQQQLSLNDDPPSTTEDALPGVKEEVGLAHLPEGRKSLEANEDASSGLLRGIPSTNLQDRAFSQSTPLATGSDSSDPHPKEDTTANSTYASHPTIPNTTARTYPLALASDDSDFKFKGVPLSKGIQQELDRVESSPTENSIDERRNLEQGRSDVATAGHGVQAEVAAVTNRNSHAEHETERKKPKFMNKLKEEVKGILHIRKDKDVEVV